MLRFTKRADYGLMAIHYIAVNEDRGAVSAKKIADESHIPSELLAKILQRLAKKKLITSQNGPKGGYALARRPADISVGDVVRALEGPINIVSCLEAQTECPQMAHCNLRRPVQKIQAAISQVLDSMSLEELTGAEIRKLFSIRNN
jgi:Rrf2 family protein